MKNILFGLYPTDTKEISIYNSLDEYFNNEITKLSSEYNDYRLAAVQATNNSIIRIQNVYSDYFYATNTTFLDIAYMFNTRYDYFVKKYNNSNNVFVSSLIQDINFYISIDNRIILFKDFIKENDMDYGIYTISYFINNSDLY